MIRRTPSHDWQLTDAEKNYGTSFQAEVGKLGGRPYYVPLELP